MTRLDDFAADGYGQFGETGMIAHLFEMLGTLSRVCVEFGAGDGLSCSNTAQLWRHEKWNALLIEPDAARYGVLQDNVDGFDVHTMRLAVAPIGGLSIGAVLDACEFGPVDFMSIDVDGDDVFILEALTCRPRVICVEFNPTVPPHLDVRQETLGQTFGASLLAIVRAARTVGYRFVGASYCNAFLVVEEEAAAFDGYETDLTVLCPPERYTYVLSDFGGRVVVAGQPSPWQVRGPYVLPLAASCHVAQITEDPQYLRRGFELLWGPAVWFDASTLEIDALRHELHVAAAPLVCVDLSNGTRPADQWVKIGAEFPNYTAVLAGPVLALVRNPT